MTHRTAKEGRLSDVRIAPRTYDPENDPSLTTIPDPGMPVRMDMLCGECGARALIPANAFTGHCPRCGMPYFLLTCTRCGNVWRRRADTLPKVCPKCKSPSWNRERVKIDAEAYVRRARAEQLARRRIR